MYLELAEQLQKNTYRAFTRSDTIVIDNGSHECRAGYAGEDPQMVFRNVLYRQKAQTSIEMFQGAVAKTMFDGDVVVNLEILEGMIDEVLRYLKPERLVNLVFTEKLYSPTHVDVVRFLFEVYGFERIQIGVDSCYACLHNLGGESCMVVDMSHSATTCLVIKSGDVVDGYKINFGGNAAGEYLSAVMFNKFFDSKKNYRSLLQHLRCADDYDREAVAILEEMQRGDYSKNYFLDEDFEVPSEEVVDRKQKRCGTPTPNAMPEVDMELLGADDADLDADGIREKKKQKILYHSTLYRLKMRVEKVLKSVSGCIAQTEEEEEKMRDLEGFVERKKSEFQSLKRELEMRSKLRKDVKNRKTYEFQIRFKEGELSADEQALAERIRSAEDPEQEDRILGALQEITTKIRELDPLFEPYSADTVDLLNGHFIGRMNVNVDLLRIPEILFSPSIIGLDQMGLSEIMEDVSRKYEVRKVFLTGGFSQIAGIAERIEREMTSMSLVGPVEVARARDPVLDAFRGAGFSAMFPTYTRAQFEELGPEEMTGQ